jgi:thiamine-phosphate diphosphorylase
MPVNKSIVTFFPTMEYKNLGLYPIVSEYSQLEQLLPLGVKQIQLRIKNKQGAELAEQIQKSIQLAKHYETKLFINDHWQLALRYSAYGVHLGQDDLANASLTELCNSGLRLGISTHSDAELQHACALQPSYIAYGPIFPTISKPMTSPPSGITALKRVRSAVSYPLIAIGGIGLAQLPEVLACQVDGIAVISAISQAQDPIQAALKLKQLIDDYAINTRRN